MFLQVFLKKFVNDVMKTFKEDNDVPIIPQWLYEERNSLFSENNERFVKNFIQKLCDFTNNKPEFNMM